MDELGVLVESGALEPLDAHFARFVGRLSGRDDPALRLGAALVSRLRGEGHVCADLAAFAGGPITTPEGHGIPRARWPDLRDWLRALAESSSVTAEPGVTAEPSAEPAEPSGEPSVTPLVLDRKGRLYLRRLYEDERRLGEALLRRVGAPLRVLDGLALQSGLNRLFGEGSSAPDHPAHGQRRAAILALLRPFAVITGGPGTGKTTTVASLLALSVEQAVARGGPPPRFLLLAPTGKAAGRLAEALREARDRLPLSASVREAIPTEAATIHRILGVVTGGLGVARQGASRHGAARYGAARYGAENPLAADLVLVDEASMVDLPLLALLVDALAEDTGLVLLGDRDQLASVEAGAALGDICGPMPVTGLSYSPTLVEAARALTGDVLLSPASASEEAAEVASSAGDASRAVVQSRVTALSVRDSLAPLTHTFRFTEHGGVGQLALAISAGDADQALGLLHDEAFPEILLIPPWVTPAQGPRDITSGISTSERRAPGLALVTLLTRMAEGYHPFFEAQSYEARFEALGRFRVLCAHRRGPYGSEALNAAMDAALRAPGAKGVPGAPGAPGRARQGAFYDGRPLLITENHYGLGLWNGDVGVVCAQPEALPEIRPGSQGATRGDAEGDAQGEAHGAAHGEAQGKGARANPTSASVSPRGLRESLMACFPSAEGPPRVLSPARLPAHETHFAVTVHKSQGSEVDAVLLVLPDVVSRVLSRELLYTAVTRARRAVTIFGRPEVLRAAIARPVLRTSGLRELLWEGDSPSP